MEKFDSMISSVTDSRLGQRSNRKTSSKKKWQNIWSLQKYFVTLQPFRKI